MKKCILFALIAILSRDSKSQNWFQNDAVWHYTHFVGSNILNGSIEVKFVKDTTFAGHNWKQFSNMAHGVDVSMGLSSYSFVYAPIFLRDSLGIQFARVGSYSDTIYDFSKVVGDTIYLNTSMGCYKGVVSATGTKTINTYSLPYQVIDYAECAPSWLFTMHDTIVQFIGSTGYFLHPFFTTEIPASTLDGQFGFFRCFKDSVIGQYYGSPFWSINSCEWNLSIDDPEERYSFVVFPNPSNNNVFVEIDNENSIIDGQLSVIDITGKLIQTISVKNGSNSISVNDLGSGLYSLIYFSSGIALANRRVIIIR
jgi:hypothetical protein